MANHLNQKPIEQVLKRFVVGYNRHDHAALASLYTDTADFVSVLGEHWVGIDDIRSKFRRIHTTFLKGSTIKTVKVRIKIVSAEIAVVHHGWKVVHDADDAKSYRGILTHIIRRVDGIWKIESSHNSTIQ